MRQVIGSYQDGPFDAKARFVGVHWVSNDDISILGGVTIICFAETKI